MGQAAANILGSSTAMATLRELIVKVARVDFPVLIEGESGTGKELVARAIHEQSRRRGGAFVAVNCAAIVESLFEAELFGIEDRTATGVRGRPGKFELAHGGTLFLDEIADLPLTAQAKLLRVLQDRAVEHVGGSRPQPIDIRVIGATNRNLRAMVDEGTFRRDLFHRLNGLDVVIPPLHERCGDIEELARAVLARPGLRHLTLAREASEALCTYRWPGNVRELERAIERAAALCDGETIRLVDLPPEVTGRYRQILLPSLEREDALDVWAGHYARMVYERHARNVRKTLRALRVSYKRLHTLMRGT
jgi:transcriptional regulator with PAS, ATPase and Fis domain